MDAHMKYYVCVTRVKVPVCWWILINRLKILQDKLISMDLFNAVSVLSEEIVAEQN